MSPARQEWLALVDEALAEDVGDGDRTTLWTVSAESRAKARIISKAAGVIAGTAVAAAVFRRLDADVRVRVEVPDGGTVVPGDLVLDLEGPARALLTGERTALNFLQHLSGVATLTRAYVDAVDGTGVAILDTRKTTPGLRALEKAAVRAGGGVNHRRGLSEMVLIKENHIAQAGGIRASLVAVRAANDEALPVEIEVRTPEQAVEALDAGCRRLLLDNMELDSIRRTVGLARAVGRVTLEASGNMTLERVRSVAATDVDCISVGALTHSAPALDLSMQVEPA